MINPAGHLERVREAAQQSTTGREALRRALIEAYDSGSFTLRELAEVSGLSHGGVHFIVSNGREEK